MNEWALLFMTVCVPTAVGGFLFLWLNHNRIIKSGQDSFKIMKLPILILAVLTLIGLFASFFHLGKPSHALYSIMGFGRSWMSNEIVFTGAFIGLACLTAVVTIWKKKVYSILILITGIIGLIDVYCMASIYVVTRVNGWDHINTYLVFYGTVFTLGPIFAASLMRIQLNGGSYKSVLKWAFAITIVGIGFQVIGTALLSVSTTELQMISGTMAGESLSTYSSMISIRWVLEVIGLILLGILAMSSLKKLNCFLIYIAVAVLIVGEGMSRYVFYVMGA